MNSALMKLEQIYKSYPVGKQRLQALRGINLSIEPGEILGIAGESGCGKSTLAKLMARLEAPTEGQIYWKGEEIRLLTPAKQRLLRQSVQLVFQNPFTALNPKMTIGNSLMEGLDLQSRLSKEARWGKLEELLDLVDLSVGFAERYPHELSGGQCQRVTLARALAVQPELLIADEPLAALDLSAQIRLTALLKKLHQETGSSMVLISHDLLLLKQLCQRVAVLYLGEVVELATPEELFKAPRHPYTQALLAAVPRPDPDYYLGMKGIPMLKAEIPSPMTPPSGCAFHTRCPQRLPICVAEAPVWSGGVSNCSGVRCHKAYSSPMLPS